jgi:hypothetical protein
MDPDTELPRTIEKGSIDKVAIMASELVSESGKSVFQEIASGLTNGTSERDSFNSTYTNAIIEQKRKPLRKN